MNLSAHCGENDSPLLYANFNQDSSYLSVGTKFGCKLFSLSNIDDGLEESYDNRSASEVCIVERFFASSLVARVSLSSPRKLKLLHTKKRAEICEYTYPNTILSVKFNRQRLVVCLIESIYIHNIKDMAALHSIRDVPPNPTGLCAFSTAADNGYLAYPGSSRTGEVTIYDTLQLKGVTSLAAHDNPLVAISFNSSASRLATASERGTVIRVFSIPHGEKLFEFRRGMKRCVQINSLSFLADGPLLAASSNTETVHIFRMLTDSERQELQAQQRRHASSESSGASQAAEGWMNYFQVTAYDTGHNETAGFIREWPGSKTAGFIQDAFKSSANYLPSQVSDMMHQERDFATARLPRAGPRNVCTLCTCQKQPRLLVASQDGFLYVFTFDAANGGDCSLVKQHRIDGCLSSVDGADSGGGGGQKVSYATAAAPLPAPTRSVPSESVPYQDPLVSSSSDCAGAQPMVTD